jgi:hypothetical protein
MRNHEIDSADIRNDTVFLILWETGKQRKTSKPPCFTTSGQEPEKEQKLSTTSFVDYISPPILILLAVAFDPS